MSKQKFRLGILLPELIELARKESLRILTVEGILDKVTEEEKEEFFKATLNAVKYNWLGIPAPMRIKGLNFEIFGPHARYTEVLLETNVYLFNPKYGIRVPIFDYNGKMTPADRIIESWACDPIDSPLDDDEGVLEVMELHQQLISAARQPVAVEDEDELDDETFDKLQMSVAFSEATHNINPSRSTVVN